MATGRHEPRGVRVAVAERELESSELIKDWEEFGRCNGMDVELFFPPGLRGPDNLAQIEAAKAICRECIVRRECLVNASEYGIWGGLTEEERREEKGYVLKNRSKERNHVVRPEKASATEVLMAGKPLPASP